MKLNREQQEPRRRVTISLPRTILNRARNVVLQLQDVSLAGLIRDGLKDQITKLEHSHKLSLPKRLIKLKAGRKNKKPKDC